MIVFGEILILENFLMGGAILYITGQIFHKNFGGTRAALRFAAGSMMCGLFSLVIFIDAKMPLNILMEACFAFGVCFVVYGRGKLVHKAVVFLLVTWFMGGMIMALLLITGNPGIYTATGIYTGDMKAGLLGIFTVICIITIRQVIRMISTRKIIQQHKFDVKIVTGGMVIKACGFLDTGNQLKEPFSGKPVAVAEAKLWQELENQGMIFEERFCVLPYQTVDSRGILMAVRTDHVEMEGRRIRGCVIAKGTGAFNIDSWFAGECGLLLSRDMIDGIF